MNVALQNLLNGFTLTGELSEDVPAFLRFHACPLTAEHVVQVAQAAGEIATRFNLPAEPAISAGLLHDVCAVIPAAERADFARQLNMDVLPEEDAFPMIIHQRLSAVFATQIFGVDDPQIISAVECHTTLKANASMMDKAVFIADKIAWDQQGTPPYLQAVHQGLETSLNAGVLAYLSWLWHQRDSLRVVHPWFRAAYLQMSGEG